MSTKFILCIYIENVSNQLWFSVVSTLNCNDICHHSSQNVVDSWGAVSESNKFWALRWQMLLLIRVRSTVNHLICFLSTTLTSSKIFLSVHDQDHIRLTWAALSVLLSKNWLIALQHCQEPWGNINKNNMHDCMANNASWWQDCQNTV